MTSLVLALLLATAADTPLKNATVSGVVQTDDGAALPGVTVTLLSTEGIEKTAVTAADGSYRFDDLSARACDIRYELSGLETVQHSLALVPGSNDLSVQALTFGKDFTIEFTCGAPCVDEVPRTQWDRPTCGEYELDTSLAQALQTQDDSARSLLRTRFETTFALQEKHRIAGMLLGKVPDDSRYWKELTHFAENAVRFGALDEQTVSVFNGYCASVGVDPDQYSQVMWNALEIARSDPRSHALLMLALDSSDSFIVFHAISGLAEQHDLAALPAIDKALARFEDESQALALGMAAFQSEDADAVALKYLDEESSATYKEARGTSQNDSLR